ncbi:hypothetical protein [Paenibacillus chitinolyticus]
MTHYRTTEIDGLNIFYREVKLSLENMHFICKILTDRSASDW